MPKKRIRIDVEDAEGARYDIKLEGNVTREKVLKVFEMLDLMNIEEGEKTPNLGSTGSKIWHIVDKEFPAGRFTSSAVLEKYEDVYNEPVKLSIISTYLARFAQRGRLQRTKTGREWAYQAIRVPQRSR